MAILDNVSFVTTWQRCNGDSKQVASELGAVESTVVQRYYTLRKKGVNLIERQSAGRGRKQKYTPDYIDSLNGLVDDLAE